MLSFNIEFIKPLPIIAPFEYSQALSNVFLSEIPNPIIFGFDNLIFLILLKYSIWLLENLPGKMIV
jgi:hypothetical protein